MRQQLRASQGGTGNGMVEGFGLRLGGRRGSESSLGFGGVGGVRKERDLLRDGFAQICEGLSDVGRVVVCFVRVLVAMNWLDGAAGWDEHSCPDIRHIEETLMDKFQGINSLLEFDVFGRELCLQDQWDVRKGEQETWMSFDEADLVICLTKLLLDVLRTSLSKRGDGRVEGRTRVVERMLVEVPNGKGLVARCGSLVRIVEWTYLMFLPKAENLSMIAIESEADGWRDDGANAAREEWAMGREQFVWNWFQADECHLGTLGVVSLRT